MKIKLILIIITFKLFLNNDFVKSKTFLNLHTNSTAIFLNNIQYNHNNNNTNQSDKPQNIHFIDKRNAFFTKQYSNEKLTISSVEKAAYFSNDTPRSRPRFRFSKVSQVLFRPANYLCTNFYDIDCKEKTNNFRDKIYQEFRNANTDDMNEPNIYNVTYRKSNSSNNVYVESEICSMINANVREIRRKDLKKMKKFRQFLPKKNKLFTKRDTFKTCAVISSAGSNLKSGLGDFIDQHDIVLRFNHAPTKGYELDVGRKTSIRIVNSQVVTKPEFKFTESTMFQNITIAAWDPGKYNSSLKEWFNDPDFNLFENYKKFLRKNPKASLYLIDPRSIWKLWQKLQDHTKTSIRKNPPSSGFIGIALLLPVCQTINIIEYIPSTRLNGKCHYYSEELNTACTFGAWHPLAAEKLMSLKMNSADDFSVFQNGILTIKRSHDNRKCK